MSLFSQAHLDYAILFLHFVAGQAVNLVFRPQDATGANVEAVIMFGADEFVPHQRALTQVASGMGAVTAKGPQLPLMAG